MYLHLQRQHHLHLHLHNLGEVLRCLQNSLVLVCLILQYHRFLLGRQDFQFHRRLIHLSGHSKYHHMLEIHMNLRHLLR